MFNKRDIGVLRNRGLLSYNTNTYDLSCKNNAVLQNNTQLGSNINNKTHITGSFNVGDEHTVSQVNIHGNTTTDNLMVNGTTTTNNLIVNEDVTYNNINVIDNMNVGGTLTTDNLIINNSLTFDNLVLSDLSVTHLITTENLIVNDTLTFDNLLLDDLTVDNTSTLNNVNISGTLETNDVVINGLLTVSNIGIDNITIQNNMQANYMTGSRVVITDNTKNLVTSNITTTELAYLSGVTSNIQNQINTKQNIITGGASSITTTNLAINKALISDNSGKVTASTVTSTELNYLTGSTSNIQNQINTKNPIITGAATTIVSNDLTTNRAVISNNL